MATAMAASQPVGCGEAKRLQPVCNHPLPLVLHDMRRSLGVRDHLADVLCLRGASRNTYPLLSG